MLVLTLNCRNGKKKGEYKPCSWAPPCWTQGRINCNSPSSILIHVFLWQWLPCWKSCSPAMLPSLVSSLPCVSPPRWSFFSRRAEAETAATETAAAAAAPSFLPLSLPACYTTLYSTHSPLSLATRLFTCLWLNSTQTDLGLKRHHVKHIRVEWNLRWCCLTCWCFFKQSTTSCWQGSKVILFF